MSCIGQSARLRSPLRSPLRSVFHRGFCRVFSGCAYFYRVYERKKGPAIPLRSPCYPLSCHTPHTPQPKRGLGGGSPLPCLASPDLGAARVGVASEMSRRPTKPWGDAARPRRRRPRGTARQREAWRRHKREERRLERHGLIKIVAEVSFDAWTEALRAFAAHVERNGDKKISEALGAIRADAPGWHDDRAARNLIASSLLAEWIARWKKMSTPDNQTKIRR